MGAAGVSSGSSRGRNSLVVRKSGDSVAMSIQARKGVAATQQQQGENLANLYIHLDGSRARKFENTLLSEPISILPLVLFFGNIHQARSLYDMREAGIEDLVNATDDLPNYYQGKLRYCRVELQPTTTPTIITAATPETKTVGLLEQLGDAFAFIDRARAVGRATMVYSVDGDDRAMSVILAYLVVREKWSLARALQMVKEKVLAMPTIREATMVELRKLGVDKDETSLS